MPEKKKTEILIPPHALRVIEKLSAAGFEACAVGGAVRDALRGAEPADWDLASSALPDEVREVFGKKYTVPTGMAHGTVTVLSLGVPVEVTSFRSDGVYSDSRHPDRVSFGCSLTEDLRRRDFTVNAMAFSPEKGLVDPFGGAEDLKRRLIRAVGDPEKRFEEDALRIMRAFRFASVLGFGIEENTLNKAKGAVGKLREVSAERLSAELWKLMCGRDAARALSLCPELVGALFPGIERGKEEHETLCRLIGECDDPRVRLALLIREKNSADPAGRARALLKALKFSNSVTDAVCAIVAEGYSFPADTVARKLLFGADRELFGAVCTYHCLVSGEDPAPLRELERSLRESGACVDLAGLAVKGSDLIKLGFSGKEVGETLALLLKKVVSEELRNDPGDLIDFARSLLRN